MSLRFSEIFQSLEAQGSHRLITVHVHVGVTGVINLQISYPQLL